MSARLYHDPASGQDGYIVSLLEDELGSNRHTFGKCWLCPTPDMDPERTWTADLAELEMVR